MNWDGQEQSVSSCVPLKFEISKSGKFKSEQAWRWSRKQTSVWVSSKTTLYSDVRNDTTLRNLIVYEVHRQANPPCVIILSFTLHDIKHNRPTCHGEATQWCIPGLAQVLDCRYNVSNLSSKVCISPRCGFLWHECLVRLLLSQCPQRSGDSQSFQLYSSECLGSRFPIIRLFGVVNSPLNSVHSVCSSLLSWRDLWCSLSRLGLKPIQCEDAWASIWTVCWALYLCWQLSNRNISAARSLWD